MELLIYESENQKNCLVTFEDTIFVPIDVLLDRTLHDINVNLERYNLVYDVSRKDIQQFCLNYFIINIVLLLKQQKSFKKIIVYITDLRFVDEQENKLFKKIIHKSLDALKIPYIESDYNISTYIAKLNKQDVDCMVEYNLLKYKLRTFDFNKFKSFLIRNNLKYLSTVFFRDPTNKMVLFG